MTLYEDADVLAIAKPAGLLVHGVRFPKSDSLPTLTLVDWLLERYPSVRGVGEDPLRPGIVHRLDRDTSGVMLIAKNQPAFVWLKKQFQEHLVRKEYRAIVWGQMKLDGGTIDAPIGRSSADVRRKSTHSSKGTIREAVTEYSVIERFAAGYTYVQVFPKTGRTHQIRVHLAHIGHPVLCDRIYAPRRACLPTMGRLALHALAIELVLPNGVRTRVISDAPEDFSATLAALRLVSKSVDPALS